MMHIVNFQKTRLSQQSFMTVIALIMSLFIALMISQPALAFTAGPDGGITSPTEGDESTSVCPTHNWVYPAPTSSKIKVQGTLNGSAVSHETPASELKLDSILIGYAFCWDLEHTLENGQLYCTPGQTAPWQVRYLASKYPPTLTDREEQAARQAAIWHYSNNFALNQSDPTNSSDSAVDNEVKERYNALVAEIDAFGDIQPPEFGDGDLQLLVTPAEATNNLPEDSIHEFEVLLTKGNIPLSGYTVYASVDLGIVLPQSGVTDSEGKFVFTLTNSTPGITHITVQATVLAPGVTYQHISNPSGKQRLIIGNSQLVEGTATKTWLEELDYGDLPEDELGLNYGMTTFESDGARHKVGGVWLGASSPDGEYDGQPNSGATGDDSGTDDEDGVVRDMTDPWGDGDPNKIIVTVGGETGQSGCMMGWLDYWDDTNKILEPDGVFQASFEYNGNTYSEIIVNNVFLAPGVHELYFTLPQGAASGVGLFARFRLVPFIAPGGSAPTDEYCTQTPVGLNGLADGGEVEDYSWLFGPTAITLQKFSASSNFATNTYLWIIIVLGAILISLIGMIVRRAQG